MKRSILLLGLMVFSSNSYAGEVSVAVASNFKHALQKLAIDFKDKTSHDLRIISASSGKLFAQIKHGAPYDVFLSADEKRPDLLIKEKISSAEDAYIYAQGKLVLLSNIEETGACKEMLTSHRLKKLAIANPKIAPYGLAAKQVLQKLGLWQQLKPRLVMGENIAQTLQFVSTNNAEAGFVAQSMVKMTMVDIAMHNTGADDACTWEVPAYMHSPINQKMVILSKGEKSVQAFAQYMRSVEAKEIIKTMGYDVL